MNLFSNIKRFARRAITAGVVSAAAVGIGLAANVATASAASCDKVNIVYCGVNNGSDSADINALRSKYNSGSDNGHNDLKAVYRWAGANDASIKGMDTNNTKLGTMYRDGDIKVDGKTVANNAWVSARFGAGQKGFVHVEGDVYARLTTTSLAEASAPVLVHFDGNGQMTFAVMINCGNAVKGHPTPPPAPKTPDYTITKEVSVKGDGNFKNQITVAPGTHVIYKVTVKSTGDTAVKNVNVADNLPNAAQYVNNTLTRDGKTIGDKAFFDGGYTIDSLDKGDSTVFKFEAVIGAKDTALQCKDQTIDNVASISTKGLKTHKDTAEVKKHCQPVSYSCDNLTATPGAIDQTSGAQNFSFKAKATAKNVKIVKYTYDFGDGKTAMVPADGDTNTISHTYQPGSYTAQVTVVFVTKDGQVVSDSGKDCKTPVKVKPQVAFTCDQLTGTAGQPDVNGNVTVNFTAKATAQNVKIASYKFNFGDNKNATVTTNATTATTSHTYAPGDYTASVTVISADNAAVTSANCQTPIHVAPVAPSSLVCSNLTATPGNTDASGNQSYSFTANATASNATITKYVFNFGDTTSSTTVTTAANTASTTHTYAPGTWVSSVTVFGTDAKGKAIQSTSVNCQKQVTVKPKECQPGVPSGSPQCFTYTCNSFTVTQGDNRTVTVASFNASSTNPNATLTSVDVVWGDSSDVTNAANIVGAQHQYAADGSYTINAVAHFAVDGHDVTVSGNNCVQTVSYNTPPTTPPVTPPTTLVNTGAGSVFGIFAAVSAVSAIAYRLFLGRKLSA